MWPFKLVLLMGILKIVGYLLLNLWDRTRKKSGFGGRSLPTVDIVLPMYNEEKVVVETIRNLLEVQYAHFSIIVVDDGSTDGSYETVMLHYGGHPKVTVVRQPNRGKSSALNKAISVSQSDIVVSVDADTQVKPDAIRQMVRYFDDERVGAVSGHIKVGNRVNLLTWMQYYEYVAIWDNDRAIFDKVNGILIVPGALGAYRRSAVDYVGGFESQVIAEDTELTLRLLYNGFVIRNAAKAVAYTEAPDNLRMFYRQRVRWTTGLSQGLIKHNKGLFTHSNKALAWLVLPFTWLFRVILPLFLPLVDYYFVYAFFFGGHSISLAWWLAVILSQTVVNYYILMGYKERIGVFRLIVLERLYRHLLFCNYWVIGYNWINGSLFRWKKITRKGNVRLEEEMFPVAPPIEQK